jgi:hypothetical protein
LYYSIVKFFHCVLKYKDVKKASSVGLMRLFLKEIKSNFQIPNK